MNAVRHEAGDSDALESSCELEDLYDTVFTRLVGELTVVAGSRAVAEDAVQEAFVRATLKWSQIRRYDDPRAWVRRVAHNLIYDHHRRRKREVLVDAPDGPSPDAFLELTGGSVANALAGLSLVHRHVLVLRAYCDFTIEEIANILGIRQGAVKSRLHRARNELADALQERSPHDQRPR